MDDLPDKVIGAVALPVGTKEVTSGSVSGLCFCHSDLVIFDKFDRTEG